jgi:hypothetical protein
MLKRWQIVVLIVAIYASAVALGIWGRYGFPVVAEKCEYTADGIKYGCAFYDVGHIALWKIGSELSNLTAIATLLTAIATLAVALVTQNQLKHNRVVQRAYVNMSPKTGVAFSETEEGRIGVTLQIKNQGVTPAHVTDVLITADTFPSSQTLPETPPYQRSHEVVPKAYLAPTTSLIFLPP